MSLENRIAPSEKALCKRSARWKCSRLRGTLHVIVDFTLIVSIVLTFLVMGILLHMGGFQ